jgi:ribonuclease HII
VGFPAYPTKDVTLPKVVQREKSRPSSRFEEEAVRLGAYRIAGVDEAGRGPLAGPVVAAAVVLSSYDAIQDLNDSKLLSPAARESLYKQIRQHATAIGVASVSPEVIDEINILQATRVAMSRAVSQITPLPDYLLIDGPIKLDMDILQRPVISGDKLSLSVAAAGIMAKVTRDNMMMELHERFPQYGFDRNKGYPTREHKEAIIKHGPSPVHRRFFRGVSEHIPGLFR